MLDIVILYFLAIMFKWYAIVCNSSSDVIFYTAAYFQNLLPKKSYDNEKLRKQLEIFHVRITK